MDMRLLVTAAGGRTQLGPYQRRNPETYGVSGKMGGRPIVKSSSISVMQKMSPIPMPFWGLKSRWKDMNIILPWVTKTTDEHSLNLNTLAKDDGNAIYLLIFAIVFIHLVFVIVTSSSSRMVIIGYIYRPDPQPLETPQLHHDSQSSIRR